MNYLKFKTRKPGIMVFVFKWSSRWIAFCRQRQSGHAAPILAPKKQIWQRDFVLLLATELFIGNESHQSLAEKENARYRGEIWPTGCMHFWRYSISFEGCPLITLSGVMVTVWNLQVREYKICVIQASALWVELWLAYVYPVISFPRAQLAWNHKAIMPSF